MAKTCFVIWNYFKDIFAVLCCFRDFLQFITCFYKQWISQQPFKVSIWWKTFCMQGGNANSTDDFQCLYVNQERLYLLGTIYAIFYIDEFYLPHILTLPLITWFTVKSTKPHLVTQNVLPMSTYPLSYPHFPTLLIIRLQRVRSECFRVFITWYFKEGMNRRQGRFLVSALKLFENEKLTPNI